MQEAGRAQLSPCDPARVLNSVPAATSVLNAPVGLCRVAGGTRFTQQNWGLQEVNLSCVYQGGFLPTTLYFCPWGGKGPGESVAL